MALVSSLDERRVEARLRDEGTATRMLLEGSEDLLIMRLWEVPTEKCGCSLKACAETEYDGYWTQFFAGLLN